MGKKSGIFEDPEDENDSLMKKMNKIPLGDWNQKMGKSPANTCSMRHLKNYLKDWRENSARTSPNLMKISVNKIWRNCCLTN